MTRARPELSVVIAIVSDTTAPARVDALVSCLDAFSGHLHDPPVELVVVHLDGLAGIGPVRERFPHVTFLAVSGLDPASTRGREHHDVLRARGLLVARGRLLALMEDHAMPDRDYCANVVAAHGKRDAVIGGAIENGVDRLLNWAVYFCDFGRYQNPVPSGDSPYASDANVSYRRSTLHSVRAAWEESFREVVVHEALRSEGRAVVLDPDIVVLQNRRDLTLLSALRERYVWGRSYASTRNATLSWPRRLAHALSAPLLPLILTFRIGRTAWQRRRLFGTFLRALPLVAVLQICWSVGEGAGYLAGALR